MYVYVCVCVCAVCVCVCVSECVCWEGEGGRKKGYSGQSYLTYHRLIDLSMSSNYVALIESVSSQKQHSITRTMRT